ncbi:MAG TPA: sugar transferase [Candidatus Paceibacterota bacterium]|nr:sugar transferase [Candidatus Paceibacterota bacterium]
MTHGGTRAAALLFLGDIAAFVAALYLTLLVRYQALPTADRLYDHIGPFSVLFVVWALVFYMSGLYGKRIILEKSSLPNALVKTQFVNIVIAALFFFLMPGVGIAPKTNLVIYLGVSLLLILGWRLALYPKLTTVRTQYPAVVIAAGEETDELVSEVNGNPRYHLKFVRVHAPHELAALDASAFARRLIDERVEIVVVDTTRDEAKAFLPALYATPAARESFQVVDFAKMYEEVFDRIPLSLLSERWFIENVRPATPLVYAVMKRSIDIAGGILMGLITFVAMPFIALANLLEAPGPLFIGQDRIGERGARIRVYKFRSMTRNDSGAWKGETENRVTKVGGALRKTSLDEFPQFINIIKGELSLIGPRNDIESLGNRLAEELPYYLFRYQALPGITGWAQINQQYEQGNISPQSVAETKVRLAYDFYYLKHRSFGLDIVIALKTIKRMFFRVSAW